MKMSIVYDPNLRVKNYIIVGQSVVSAIAN